MSMDDDDCQFVSCGARSCKLPGGDCGGHRHLLSRRAGTVDHTWITRSGLDRVDRYGLHDIWSRWHSGFVDGDFPAEFGAWLDRLEATAREGDDHARTMLVFIVRALNHLRGLDEAPARDEETAGLRWV